MKQKYVILSLICLTVVGAFFAVLASNMLFSDVGNISSGASTFAVSLPAALFAATFVVAILYLIRITKRPECFRRITHLYLIVALALNGLGFAENIFSAVTVYGTLVSKHPFPGYTIIFLVLEAAVIGGAIFGLLKLKNVKQDEVKTHINFGYVMKTIGWFLFISLMLNRLGTFLGMPFYVYLRNLYKTFPFYLFLLVPLYLGVVKVLFTFKLIDRKQLKLFAIIGLAVNVALFAYTAIMGITDTAFISSLSQAMPMERLASKPVELPIHFLAYTGVGISLLVTYKKSKED